MKLKKINAPKIIALSFFGIIILGAIVLSLPISTVNKGEITLTDALFTSTSAVCVTGLSVVDVGTYFTFFGQIVILILIQIGGLGIMTLSTFFLITIGKRLFLNDVFVIEASFGKETIHGVKSLVKYILLITFVIELIGSSILAWRFYFSIKYPLSKAVYYGIFHSVSAFNNAGIALFRNSLEGFKNDWVVLLTVAFLIILGGIGFLVMFNINTYKFWKKNIIERGRIRLQTKIVLTMTALLLLAGTAVMLILEWNNTLNGLSVQDKIVNGFFHSVTPRTAGFNSLPVQNMTMAALFFTLFLMFVGGSPGSTAGGIKTSTFMVLVSNAINIAKGESDVQLFNRKIPKKVIQESMCVIAICLGLVFLSTLMLLISENNSNFMAVIYEVISAFANVGLSMGITPFLSCLGKLVIVATMFVGRISPLTVAMIVGRKQEASVINYPEETVIVG